MVQAETASGSQTAPSTAPLLIASMAATPYAQLVGLVQKLPFGSDENNTLLEDLSFRVVEYLTIERVQSQQVAAVACSSAEISDQQHDLAECLSRRPDSWWMSQTGSMPRGKGNEYVEFQLSSNNALRRLSAVSISIPPLPAGPASLRDFVLLAPIMQPPEVLVGSNTGSNNTDDDDDDDDTTSSTNAASPPSAIESWRPISPQWQLQNRSGPQRFAFDAPGVDVDRLRLVCLSNQISVLAGGAHVPINMTKVGFLTISFE